MEVIFKKNGEIKTEFDDKNRLEIIPDVSWNSKLHPWDDFGYKTTFQSKLFFENKDYDLPQIKILIKDNVNTHSYFKTYLEEKKENYFLFPLGIDFISLATDIEFYEALKSLLDENIIFQILEKLSDAVYIKNNSILDNKKYLLETEGFNLSLLRDMTNKKAYENGWNIIKNDNTEKNLSFKINFKLSNYNNYHEIEINLKKSIFPSNINILIGSNGTGKSQTISHLIKQLLNIDTMQQLEKLPVFSQIVLIAYSPYEEFITHIDSKRFSNIKPYLYFGFRDKNNIFDLQLPNRVSSNCILGILEEDKNKEYLKRLNKFDNFLKVINKAIDFDYMAFEINTDQFYEENEIKYNDKIYAKINKSSFFDNYNSYLKEIIFENGLFFFKNDTLLKLSSGQSIFVQMISNIVASIREDTIILLDEPELYLHPNLEVELLELLKELLDDFKSYAIVSTHSAIIAREVSKDYISILKNSNNTIFISRPPFETIGANLERINSYVFFDKDIKKPYQDWLQSLVNKYGSADKVLEQYEKKLNEESIILLYGMKQRNAN
ncbi:iron-dicitrate transporter ATP-binding subunit [Aliarcobacter thereius]|uniref:Iron-dicitrate transporter ATP-binding subunit n=1 Tax=Aliarcobacter thereius TaxID=544718 RepID=A0A1C0B7L1_9BACT|nr:AAA family ATPase [Aliarcobacter thereius]OCL99588.1 iron-dicitrate transporter ATP-binding subunit [Aliarcobacter thereius]